MPSSRMFEMLADSLARPSQPFLDTQAALGAANDVVGSVGKFQKEKRLGTKISDILGDGTYKGLTLRDLEGDGSPLLKLMKLKDEMGPQDYITPHYDESGNVSGVDHLPPQKKGSKVIAPSTVNVYRGKEFEHKVSEDSIGHAQTVLKEAKKAMENAAPAGVVIDQGAYDSAKAQYDASTAFLSKRGVPLGMSSSTPKAAPQPNPANQGGQPVPAPDADREGDYLKSIKAKDTPANRAWAKSKIGG